MGINTGPLSAMMMPLESRREAILELALIADKRGYTAVFLPETWTFDTTVLLTEIAVRKLPTWKTGLKWLGVVLLGSVATGIPLVFGDQFFIAQVDSGNPWYNPVFGYAFPVFLVNILTLVWVWYKYHSRSR